MKIVLLAFAFSFIVLTVCCVKKKPVLTNQGMFQGIFVVVPTPLKENQGVDTAGLAHLVNYYIEAGCHGVLLLGSGGEYPYFTLQEKKEIIAAGVRAARGRVPVMVGA
jgi:dihydrodipicolinate synthase/N-acetylneuraminate lyase